MAFIKQQLLKFPCKVPKLPLKSAKINEAGLSEDQLPCKSMAWFTECSILCFNIWDGLF